VTGVQAYADLAARVLASPARLGPVRWVAVDGRAGSGKTTFAARLSAALRVAGASVAEVHTDDLLAGWTDIETYWPRLEEWILEPLRAARAGAYRRYDWLAGRFVDEWTPLPVPDVLVVEGVASARGIARPELTLSVCVLADRDLRLERGIARDGEGLRAQWLEWLADEDNHYATEQTEERADLLVDGAPELPHDAETEFVLATGRRAATAAGRSVEA
jgi:uridine kinase